MSDIIPGPDERGLYHWTDSEIATAIAFTNYLAQFTERLPSEVACLTKQFMGMQTVRVEEARMLRRRCVQIGSDPLLLELAQQLCKLHTDPERHPDLEDIEAEAQEAAGYQPICAKSARVELALYAN